MSTQQQTFGFLSGRQRPSAVQTAEGGRPPRQNVVIEAGAGTGKTTAIVAKVLDLLLGDDDVAPERMVLVTFTEKAAGEIADRIQSALTEIERGADRWPVNSDRPLFQVGPAARRAVADDSLILPVASSSISDRSGHRSAVPDHRRLRSLAAVRPDLRRLDR